MLNNIKSVKTKKVGKRLGRGIGSGVGGHTVGRGQKGAKSRSGFQAPRLFFEGGSMPLNRRLPKLRGFSRNGINSKFVKAVINMTKLNTLEEGTTVTLENMRDLGLVFSKSKNIYPKVLAGGKLEKKINIEGVEVSLRAKELIEKLGGKVS